MYIYIYIHIHIYIYVYRERERKQRKRANDYTQPVNVGDGPGVLRHDVAADAIEACFKLHALGILGVVFLGDYLFQNRLYQYLCLQEPCQDKPRSSQCQCSCYCHFDRVLELLELCVYLLCLLACMLFTVVYYCIVGLVYIMLFSTVYLLLLL